MYCTGRTYLFISLDRAAWCRKRGNSGNRRYTLYQQEMAWLSGTWGADHYRWARAGAYCIQRSCRRAWERVWYRGRGYSYVIYHKQRWPGSSHPHERLWWGLWWYRWPLCSNRWGKSHLCSDTGGLQGGYRVASQACHRGFDWPWGIYTGVVNLRSKG